MECLSVGAEYKREVVEARGQPVQAPLLMAAFNCSTSEEFFAETVTRIRSRWAELSIDLGESEIV